MTDVQLLQSLKQAELSLGFSSKQFSGAVVVSLLKQVLGEIGIHTSEKDVFIKGVPIEIDFLIVRPEAKPEFGVLWNPSDVLAAFELKKSGVITEECRSKVNSDFHRIKTYCPCIKLFYVAVSETHDKLGSLHRSDNSFIFFQRRNGKFSSTGDFDTFLETVKTCVAPETA